MRNDIQHILSGKSQVKHHHLIQAVTLKEAKEQAQWLKTNSSSKKKKQRA